MALDFNVLLSLNQTQFLDHFLIKSTKVILKYCLSLPLLGLYSRQPLVEFRNLILFNFLFSISDQRSPSPVPHQHQIHSGSGHQHGHFEAPQHPQGYEDQGENFLGYFEFLDSRQCKSNIFNFQIVIQVILRIIGA